MADPRAIVQVALSRNGGLGQDTVINTWHFEGDADAAESDRARWDGLIGGLAGRLATFYNTIGPYLSMSLAGSGRIKAYDFADPPTRIPRFEGTFTHPVGGGTLPGEVAVVLSMLAAPLPGVNPRRRRGRVYLGPLTAGVSQYLSTDVPDPVPSSAFVTAVLSATQVMATGGGGAFRLSTFSPTTIKTGGSVDSAWNDVASVYIDNAFDTQRRRGGDPTSRVTAAIAP
jgi:hypothetical protein